MKVLIIDDSVFSQKVEVNLIKKFLDDDGDIEFFCANDGQEGWAKYKEIQPDYIFVDLLMPNLNGRELIKLIKADHADAKIVVVSADVQKSIKEEIEAYNVMLFVNKPFNEDKAQFVCNMIRNDRDGR